MFQCSDCWCCFELQSLKYLLFQFLGFIDFAPYTELLDVSSRTELQFFINQYDVDHGSGEAIHATAGAEVALEGFIY